MSVNSDDAANGSVAKTARSTGKPRSTATSRRAGASGVGSPSRGATRTTTSAKAKLKTLAIDVGGTGIKASVLDDTGTMIADRVRVETKYPCSPKTLLETLELLVKGLPAYDRISVGFPGMVRAGNILSAPHFIAPTGPGGETDPELFLAWNKFDLAGKIEEVLMAPTRVVNDADLQGAAVISGEGLELVITLGTGLGTALFDSGRLAPHLELAHHSFRKGKTYDEQIGEGARSRIGSKKWNKRVALAVDNLDRLVMFDHLFIGGGNAKRVRFELGERTTLVDNTAGIIGGIRLWEGNIFG